ncbi:MAG: hypothetical protein QOG62_467 [Thermoleophilaceae bacterium]|jgi:alpha-beta hydrolase superfamily lysophospholipase|nr:hypothetical protein [Thermoleophilaceae bacterium]
MALAVMAVPAGAAAKKDAEAAPGVPKGPVREAFYNPPAKLGGGGNGSLIWAREIRAPKGADAWKVLYRSTLQTGKRIAVSGIVVAPEGKAPNGGRPVVAWAHGTVGGGRPCAPSAAPNPARALVDYFTFESPFKLDVGVPALPRLLKAGYVVAATDYQGLGTPGTHQYVVADTEIRNIFDSVKAAQGLPTGAGKKMAVLGWSQGGGASLFAGQDPGYGKPLKVVGVAALAPAADVGPQAAGQVPAGPVSNRSPWQSSGLQINLFRGMHAAYPELDLAQVLSPTGLQAEPGLKVECIEHFVDVLQNYPDPAVLFSGSIPADWQRRLNENTAGNAPTVAPALVMQGTADTVINPNSTTNYVQRACQFGRPIQYSVYPNQTHQTIPFVARPEYLPWIADRFAGKPPPSNC